MKRSLKIAFALGLLNHLAGVTPTLASPVDMVNEAGQPISRSTVLYRGTVYPGLPGMADSIPGATSFTTELSVAKTFGSALPGQTTTVLQTTVGELLDSGAAYTTVRDSIVQASKSGLFEGVAAGQSPIEIIDPLVAQAARESEVRFMITRPYPYIVVGEGTGSAEGLGVAVIQPLVPVAEETSTLVKIIGVGGKVVGVAGVGIGAYQFIYNDLPNDRDWVEVTRDVNYDLVVPITALTPIGPGYVVGTGAGWVVNHTVSFPLLDILYSDVSGWDTSHDPSILLEQQNQYDLQHANDHLKSITYTDANGVSVTVSLEDANCNGVPAGCSSGTTPPGTQKPYNPFVLQHPYGAHFK